MCMIYVLDVPCLSHVMFCSDLFVQSVTSHFLVQVLAVDSMGLFIDIFCLHKSFCSKSFMENKWEIYAAFFLVVCQIIKDKKYIQINTFFFSLYPFLQYIIRYSVYLCLQLKWRDFGMFKFKCVSHFNVIVSSLGPTPKFGGGGYLMFQRFSCENRSSRNINKSMEKSLENLQFS